MLKYLIAIMLVVFLTLGSLYAHFATSFFIDLRPDTPISVAFRAEDESIVHRNEHGYYAPIQLRGVELSPSLPGNMVWDFAPDVYDYLRWFGDIYEMGANTILAQNIMDPDFYNALYRFNMTNDSPLLLLQGVYGGHDYRKLTSRLKEAVDIIHGSRINLIGAQGLDIFRVDVSPWVVGFLVGSEWDPDTVVFMNHFVPELPDSFEGEFFSSAEDASRFEVMLAQIMDDVTSYETRRYKTQRPISFIASPMIDFLEYEEAYRIQLRKYARLNHEHIIPSENMRAGMFASYRLFYFTDDFSMLLSYEQRAYLSHILADLDTGCFMHGYLDLLMRYHTMPVVATGFGVSSGRAPYIVDRTPFTELEQGEAIADMIVQIESSGWAGSIISSWQDTWERRTWNTAFSSDPWRYHYWHNLQSADQGYGLMTFDPGFYYRPVLIDGNADEWNEHHFVHEYGGIRIYAQYSTHGLYLLILGEGVNPQNSLYLPIDVTPRTGTSTFGEYEFERPSDFLLVLSGRHESRLLVNQRYNAMFQRFHGEITGDNPFTDIPPRWESELVPITIALQNTEIVSAEDFKRLTDEAREMGRLRYTETGILTHGIGDPNSPNFNSLADFFFGENLVEVRIPWMLLNFFDPSTMRVHDDYFEHFGVEGLNVSQIYIGVANTKYTVAPMSPISLEGWRHNPPFHERLKQSYFIIQQLWRN